MGNVGITSQEECLASFAQDSDVRNSSDVFCNATLDDSICWPMAAAGETIVSPCPRRPGYSISKDAVKFCGLTGTWMSNNYANCTSDFLRQINKRFLQSNISTQALKSIALDTRRLETAGLSLSVTSLIISICIFSCIRSIRCDRNRIHCNLFVAVLIHTIVLFAKNLDQILNKKPSAQNMPIVCEMSVLVAEYTDMAMFAWMFVEGLYLNRLIASSVFSSKPNYALYHAIGWGASLLVVGIWSIVNGFLNKEVCWYAYAFQSYYWILQAPKFLIIIINFCFLINIMRVLVMKLRENNSTEIAQVRKAARATVVLLPLLGANNILSMIDEPVYSVVSFAIYNYASQVLSSFQGVFISLFYCFLNSEVQCTLRRKWNKACLQRRGLNSTRGHSMSMTGRTSVTGRMSMNGRTSMTGGKSSPDTTTFLNSPSKPDRSSQCVEISS